MTSIIALTFLIGITANYAIAADIEVVEGDINAGNPSDFHAWQLSGTDGTSLQPRIIIWPSTWRKSLPK